MSQPERTGGRERPAQRRPRSFVTLAALGLGAPLAVGVLALVNLGPLKDTPLHRYVSHPVENVEVLMFCCALAALLAKLLGSWKEGAACRREPLPPWDGQAVHAAEAGRLLSGLRGLGRGFQNTRLARRVAAVLDFVHSRGSANELDDQIRTLADNEAVALEGSYALIRFITWAIPILGFLGTVLGITQSISNVTPETLEKNLDQVTGGLALAFDATALGLGLTMLTMFLTFLVERVELGVLERVDQYADEQLAHRFERTGPHGGEFVAVVRQNTQVLLTATEQLVERQAAVWARALAEAQQHWAEEGNKQQERLATALEAALERTLADHAQRLAELEKQSLGQSAAVLERLAELAAAVRDTGREQGEALGQLAQSLAAQTQALAALQDGEQHLLRLQETLNQNLATLNGAGAFEQAVHSLTAAIHLLTVRGGGVGTGPNRLGPPRPGAAA
jgi:biopolymer transport protein ExbB/TolQ